MANITIQDVQQGFADNFPLKSTVIVFNDTPFPWDSTDTPLMGYRTIAVNETSEDKWILFDETGAATDEASWSSFTSSLDNLNGGSGIILQNDGSIDLGGPLTENTTLTGTNGVDTFEIEYVENIVLQTGERLGADDTPQLGIIHDTTNSIDSVYLTAKSSTIPGLGGDPTTGFSSIQGHPTPAVDGTRVFEETADSLDLLRIKDETIALTHLNSTTGNNGGLSINDTSTVLAQVLNSGEEALFNLHDGVATFTSTAAPVRGMFYDDNYNGDWGTSGLNLRVIVDKGFVEEYVNENATIDAQNGLTVTPNTSGPDVLKLGGDLNTDTIINGTTAFDFSVTDTDVTTMSSQNATTISGNNTGTATTVTVDAGFGVTSGGAVSIATTGATASLNTASSGITFDDAGANTVTAANDIGLVYASATYRPNFTDLTLVDKGYVDAVASGLVVKAPVVAVADVNVPQQGTGGPATVDGVLLANGDRVLLTNQSTLPANGIYVVGPAAWLRADDADETGEIVGGSYVFVDQGTTYADTGWVQTEDGAIVPDVDDQVWVLFNRAGFVQGGNGIDVTGNIVSVDLASPSGMEFNAGKLQIDLDASTTSGMKIDANGLSLQLNDYNAQTDVKIQTTDNDLLLIDESLPNTTSTIGITASDSTNVSAAAQNAILIANEVTGGSAKTSYLGIERDTGDVFIRRDDVAANTRKVVDFVTGSATFGVQNATTFAAISTVVAGSNGSLSLLATTATGTFDLGFSAAATITDNRAVGTTQTGLIYAADYVLGFDANDRALPDVGWVKDFVNDNATILAGSGLTLTTDANGPDTIDLGGALTGDANLTGAGTNEFTAESMAAITLTSIVGADNASIDMQPDDMQIRLFDATNSITQGFTPAVLETTINDGTDTLTITQGANTFTVEGTTANFEGIVYADDYSDNYNGQSLVDKDYVDAAVTDITIDVSNGLSKDTNVGLADTIKWGGSPLTEATSIGGATNSLELGTSASKLSTADIHFGTSASITDGGNNSITINSTANTVNVAAGTSITQAVNAGHSLVLNTTASSLGSVYTDGAGSAAGALGLQYADDAYGAGFNSKSLIHHKYYWDNLTAENVDYDPSNTGGTSGGGSITSTDVQGAIDEIDTRVDDLETTPVTSSGSGITVNPDGTVDLGGTLTEEALINLSSNKVKLSGSGEFEINEEHGSGEWSRFNFVTTKGTQAFDVLLREDTSVNAYNIFGLDIQTGNDFRYGDLDTGGFDSRIFQNSNSMTLKGTVSGNTDQILLSKTIGMQVTSAITGAGITYATDYTSTPQATALTLATKGYVDTEIGDITLSGDNAITITGSNVIEWGGTLNKDTTVDSDGTARAVTFGGTAALSSFAVTSVANTITGTTSSTLVGATSTLAIDASSLFTDAKAANSRDGLRYAVDYTFDTGASNLTLATKGYVDTTIQNEAELTAGNGINIVYGGTQATNIVSAVVNTTQGFSNATGTGFDEIGISNFTSFWASADATATGVFGNGLDWNTIVTDKLTVTADATQGFQVTASGVGISDFSTFLGQADADGVYGDGLVWDGGNAEIDVVLNTGQGFGFTTNQVGINSWTNFYNDANTTGAVFGSGLDWTAIETNKLSVKANTTQGFSATTGTGTDEVGISNFASFGTAADNSGTGIWGTGLTWNTSQLDVDETEFDPTNFDLTQGSVWVGDGSAQASELAAQGNTQILIGNGTTIASFALSGDVTMTNGGAVTIADSAVTSAKIDDGTIENGDLNKTAIPLSGFAVATADIDMGAQRITNMADGLVAQDAVTKSQLDAVAAGLNAKESCRYIALSPIGTVNIGNNSAGAKDAVAAALDIVDGSAVVAGDIADGDRILVVAEGGSFSVADAENGIYFWSDTTGLTRSLDFDGSPVGEVASGDFTYVALGDNGGNAQWVLVEPVGDADVGTDPMLFTPLAGPTAVNAGAGLVKIANILQVELVPNGGLEFDLPAGTNGIDDPASKVQINIDDVGGANLATAININAEGVSVKVDDSTIEEGVSGQLRVKAAGITSTEIGLDAVNDTHLDLGEAANQVQPNTFILSTGYTAAVGTVAVADGVEDAIEKLDGNIQDLNTNKAQTGSAVQVAANGVVDWDGAMTKDATVTGATQTHSVLLGGDGLNANRLNSFEVYAGSETLGGALTIANADGTIALTSLDGSITNAAKDAFTATVDSIEQISADKTSIKIASEDSSIELDDAADNVVTDGNATPKGLVYASATYRDNFVDESLVDKKYVDDEILNSVPVQEVDEFNPFIDVASTSGTDTVIKIGPGEDYVFLYDPAGEVSMAVNGLGEARGASNAWIVVDPNNSYTEVPEGSEKNGDAIQWNNDYFLESDDIVTVRYIRAAGAGTNGA